MEQGLALQNSPIVLLIGKFNEKIKLLYGRRRMDTQELQAGLNLLVEQIEHKDDDDHEFWMNLHQTLSGMRAMGMPIPDDLRILEEELAARFSVEVSETT